MMVLDYEWYLIQYVLVIEPTEPDKERLQKYIERKNIETSERPEELEFKKTVKR